MKRNNGPEVTMARVSQLFDVLNKITIDAIISAYQIGERELLRQHMLNLMPNALVLLDRGYPAYWIFNLILSRGGNFSGKSALSVYQDFHSRVLSKNLIWILASPAQDVVKNESEGNKYEHQINMTQAISKSKDTLFLLFERPRDMIVQLIQKIHAIFIASTEPIRPGRNFERNHKVNKREHYMNYKPCR